MKDTFLLVILFISIFLLGFTIGGSLAEKLTSSKLQKQAIDKGFAHYNPTNGVWQWKDKVE